MRPYNIRTLLKHWLMPLLLLILLLIANVATGSIGIPIKEIINALTGQATQEPIWKEIIWNFRLTKALTCMLSGSALALGGLQMQTLFRNPLAGPDVLGLSSGASLAVSLLFMSAGLPLLSLAGPWAVAITASLGCGTVFIIVLIFARRIRDPASLLIIGLMIGAGTHSIVSVLQFSSKAEELQTFLIWTFGSVGGLGWGEIHVLFWVLTVGSAISLFSVKSLNTWLLGDNYAQSLGVNLRRSRLLIILSTSVLTGGVTAFCGPIAFIGLAVPHLTRLLIKTTNHKVLIPHVMMVGAALLLLCDILTQAPGGGRILPLNAITALFGAPVIIWLVMRSRVIRL